MSQPTGQPNQPIRATRPAEADDRERRPTAAAGRRSTRAAGDDPLATAIEASRPGVLLCLLLALDGFVVLAFQLSVPARDRPLQLLRVADSPERRSVGDQAGVNGGPQTALKAPDLGADSGPTR